MVNLLTNKTKITLYIIIPVIIAIYMIFPLLAGYYAYPVAEYSIYKSFMVNFINSLKAGVLPQWNEYVGCGHPAMYFGHYPISQNTLIYMLFGFSDFTYYVTRCLNLIILIFAFIYAARFLKIDYWVALLGALTYFSVNFVSRVLIAETIGNLVLVYPLLIILLIKIIQEHKIKDILLFSLVYIFWLTGGHIIYVYMHLIMLSVIFCIGIFLFNGYNTLKPKNLLKYIWLYFLLFALPFLAVLYQYYFVYDVISVSNRLKHGLIVSPFEPIVWKQLLESFKSSSYIFIGLALVIAHVIFKLISWILPSLKKYRVNFIFLLIISFMFFTFFALPEKSLKLLRVFGINYSIVTSECNENYILVGDSKENIVKNGKFTNDTSGWKEYLTDTAVTSDKNKQKAIKLTSKESATGYIYYLAETEPGQNYKISVSYRRGLTADGQIKVGNFPDDTSLYYSGVISNPEWKEYKGSFSAASRNTYITLVNLTSTKGENSYFTDVTLQKLKPAAFSDYIPILKSKVFQAALFIFLLFNFFVLYKTGKSKEINLQFIFRIFTILAIYISLISYYFFSPANIIGDVNGYDYDLFKELSLISQFVFVFFVLYSLKKYSSEKFIKITIFSLVALYFIRSHLTIPLLRFFGIVWYAPRDGSIFSALFAILFMFGLKEFLQDFFQLFKYKNKQTAVTIKYLFLIFILIIMVKDSEHKFYNGTSHKFVYALRYPTTPMEVWIANGRGELKSFTDKMLELDKQTKHFYRIFSGQNHYLYLAGYLQQYKIHEAAIYESSYSNDLNDFYNYTILGKKRVEGDALKNVMPYFLFTKHVHDGLGLKYKDILYKDFFLFSPKYDSEYFENQNIEFMWDLMQVKYIIAGPELLDIVSTFNTFNDYRLIANYPVLPLKIYERTKAKNFFNLAVYPLPDGEKYNEVIANINSNDVNALKRLYSKLIFLDKDNQDFKLQKMTSKDNERYYDIKSNQPALLVDFESYNRHWRLKINDRDENISKAFQVFKAIKLERGINRIKLSYNLKYFKELFFVSVFVILAYLIFSVMYYRKKLMDI